MGLPQLLFTCIRQQGGHYFYNRPAMTSFCSFRRALSSTSMPPDQPLKDSATLINDPASGSYLPPPPVSDQLATAVDSPVNVNVGEVRLFDIGLANSWRPGSWVQAGLDALHFDFHLPWWQAICIGTVIVRLCMFPLVIRAQRFMANYSNHMPIIMKKQQEMSMAVGSNNPLEAERLSKEYTDYLKKNNLLSFRQYAPMLAQGFIFMSVFTGLREMAVLPVDSMRTGGLAWFTDLTLMDPYFLLPLMTSATLFVTIRMGADGMSPANMPMRWMRTGFQLMPLFILPLTAFFPSAMCLYWFTSNAFSCMQVSILRQPKIREYFHIPAIVKLDPKLMEEQQASMRNSWGQMRAAFKQQSALARARDHEQLEQAVRHQRLREVMEKQLKLLQEQQDKQKPSSDQNNNKK